MQLQVALTAEKELISSELSTLGRMGQLKQ